MSLRRARSLGKLRFEAIVFAPAGFLDYARNDEAKYRFVWFAGGRGRPPLPALPKVDTGIADMPTAARRSLPRDFSTTLEMTKLSTVTFDLRADGASAPTCSTESRYGHRRLARRDSLSAMPVLIK